MYMYIKTSERGDGSMQLGLDRLYILSHVSEESVETSAQLAVGSSLYASVHSIGCSRDSRVRWQVVVMPSA